MPNTQEWQSENKTRAFPFTAITDDSPPNGFIVDLKFFPDRHTERDIYLSEMSYFVSSDSYELTFKYQDDSSIAINGVVPRLSNGIPIEGVTSYLFDEESILAFTPGSDWNDPSWGYTDPEVPEDFTREYALADSKVEPTLINPGPNTIRRIFIADEEIPDESEWGKNVEQILKGGYNVDLAQSTNTQTVGNLAASQIDSIPFIDLSAIGGAGAGYPPEGTEQSVLRTINGMRADEKGNLKLTTKDCLNIFKPEEILHTLQIVSDCLPCCGCDSYRAFSAAISRRSTKLKELCTILGDAITANAALYNEAVESINAHRAPIARVRNFRCFTDRFRISVQNICSIPIYVHVGITLGGSGPSIGSFTAQETGLIAGSYASLSPLTATNKDYDNNSPDTPTGGWTGFILGAAGGLPINPGAYTDITFEWNTPTGDLRAEGVSFEIQANGIYGAQKTYGCVKDTYTGSVEVDPYLPEVACSEEEDPIVRYRTVSTS